MNIVLQKSVRSMRIIALPLARLAISQDRGAKAKPNTTNLNAKDVLVFYHFDLISPYGGHENLPWRKRMLKRLTSKAMDVWTSLGKAPKGSWKLWTYQLGERIADRIEFEELALRSIDPSLGPALSPTRGSEQVDDAGSQTHSLPRIPLIYPPSLYPACLQVGDRTSHPSLVHLQTLLATCGPQHRRGFYLWMFVAPLTLPITLIPIIPNFPLFFCVWRSWSHFRAYKSSQYLSSLLNRRLIEPSPSLELDRLFASPSSSEISQSHPSVARRSMSSEKSLTSGGVAADRTSEATFGAEASRFDSILNREAMPGILALFNLPAITTVDINRAIDQAHRRLGK